MNEFGYKYGLTRLEITSSFKELSQDIIDSLTLKIDECLILFKESQCIYKNPLQNYINNYCNEITSQLLIKTQYNYYVIWSVNNKSKRVQGVIYKRATLADDKKTFIELDED